MKRPCSATTTACCCLCCCVFFSVFFRNDVVVAVFERMAFSIAFTTIAEENGLTETEKGFAMASYYFGFTVSQVCMYAYIDLYAGRLPRRYVLSLCLSFSVSSNGHINTISLRRESSSSAGQRIPARTA